MHTRVCHYSRCAGVEGLCHGGEAHTGEGRRVLDQCSLTYLQAEHKRKDKSTVSAQQGCKTILFKLSLLE